MRSPYSNPLGAGLNAFTQVVNTMEGLEASKQRRELMAQDAADRKMRNERESEEWDRKKKAWNEQDERKIGQDKLDAFVVVREKIAQAEANKQSLDLTSLPAEELASVLAVGDKLKLLNADGTPNSRKVAAARLVSQTIRREDFQKGVVGGGKLDISKMPDIQEALNELFGDDWGESTDKAGNKTKNKINQLYFKDGNVSFGVEVNVPTGAVNPVLPDKGKPVYSIPEDPAPEGLTVPGNMDIAKRKVFVGEDRKAKILMPITVPVGGGQYAVVPSVGEDGTVLTKDQAIEKYMETKQHLGVFETEAAARDYEGKVQSSSMWKDTIAYYRNPTYQSVKTHGHSADPDDPVKQIPVALIGGKIIETEKLASMIDELSRKYGPTEFTKRVQATRDKQAHDRVIRNAMDQSGGNVEKFAAMAVVSGMPPAEIKKYTDLPMWGEKDKEQRRKLEEILFKHRLGKDLEGYKDRLSRSGKADEKQDITKEQNSRFDDNFYRNFAGQIPGLVGGEMPDDINKLLAIGGKFKVGDQNVTMKQYYDAMRREYAANIRNGMPEDKALAAANKRYSAGGAVQEAPTEEPPKDNAAALKSELNIHPDRTEEEIRQMQVNVTNGTAKMFEDESGNIYYEDGSGRVNLSEPKKKATPKELRQEDKAYVKEWRAKHPAVGDEVPDEEIIKRRNKKPSSKGFDFDFRNEKDNRVPLSYNLRGRFK